MTMSDTYSFGQALADELHAEREGQRITLDDLARRSGVPKVTLQRYLAGSRDIKVGALADICKALGLTVGEVAARAQRRFERVTQPLDENGTGSLRRSNG
jgi:transcriptional regulator with XRE-family HTH domain